jgi:hypothetical protein
MSGECLFRKKAEAKCNYIIRADKLFEVLVEEQNIIMLDQVVNMFAILFTEYRIYAYI